MQYFGVGKLYRKIQSKVRNVLDNFKESRDEKGLDDFFQCSKCNKNARTIFREEKALQK